MEYGQFCPIAKASEILGEKWTILIVRELLMGSTRFNVFQRALGQISPTLLTKRLNFLVEQGLVVKKKIPGQLGYEYFPTQACQELLPVIKSLGDWGMRWARNHMVDDDYDVELLMLYLQRSVQPEKLPGSETVIRFQFTDLKELSNWWIIARSNEVDVCVKDPGKETEIYFTCSVKTMIDIWMGDLLYHKAVSSGEMKVVGSKFLSKNIFDWMSPSVFADLPPANNLG